MGIKSTIQAKLISLFLLLSLVPLITLFFIAYNNVQKALKKNIGIELENTAFQTIDKIDRLLFHAKEEINALAAAEVMQDIIADDPDGRITASLIRLKKEYRAYSGIFCINPQGKIVAASEPEKIGQDVSAESWFKKPAEASDIHFGDLKYHKLISGFAVTFCVPIVASYDETEVIGFLSAHFKWKELYEIANAVVVNEEGQNESGYVLMINKKGLVISGPSFILPEKEEEVFSSVNLLSMGYESPQLAIKGQKGHLIEPGPDGKEWLIGYAGSHGFRDFPGFGWAVLVMQEAQAAFAPVTKFLLEFIGVSLMLGVCVLIVAILVSRSFSVPIQKLTTIANRIAKGDLSQTIKIRTKDEIGELANAFNHMTEDLKRSRDELITTRDYTNNIIKFMADTLIVVDSDLIIKIVNQATLNLLGYREEELIGKRVDMILAEEQLIKESVFEKLVKNKGFINLLEIKYLSKDGKKIPVLFSASLMRHANGESEGIVCVALDITTQKQAEEQIKASLREKEVLLREIHHRVKNNMQVVSSLLKLQAGYIKDKQYIDMFKDSQNRIKSMSLIHEKLYQSKDLSKIDFNDYIRNLATDLFRSYGVNTGKIALKIDIKDVSLGVDSAIPCGLITSELVSNSLKYAFPNGRNGKIDLVMRSKDEDQIELIVRDNGIGLPKDLDFRNTESLGLQLVTTLAEDQLNGKIEVNNSKGTEFRIKFKEIKYKERI